jgi:hypothetical protein
MKQSRIKQSFALAALVYGGLLTHGALAQVSVERVDADTLRVTEFQGKPPHRRQFISQSEHPELYQQYEARLDDKPVALVGAETSRKGAPGKTTASSVRISSSPQEVTEFARFEETAEPAAKDARRWSGAPGKGIPTP